ncbi:phage tail spike protein [Staphylococcus aureus]|uniref:phage tail spike protein n=1 Tax=Staphylococcus aureus TaxID=1280 RepID=UPI0025561124|nr:phage tail spike protein [Staphylococcus aureus]WIO53652.1 phage tail spike protein [Staphylococcus aureus]WIO65244.1 phage tail spike protein [Staphylococcus aureus]WIO68153.1 phage tail spike protein [Staphylococcus aureus]WRN11382.1 phage tail spike protein [Staphylococcus aureus]
MTLNNHFAYTFEERPTPKLWLCKPDGTRIERIADFSKLGGTFKFTNVNTLHFDLPLQVFSEDTKQIERNKVVDLVKNKYLIDYRYNGYRDIFVIDDIKKSANDSDFITLNLDSRASELNKKAANEIELLGSTIPQMMNKILSIYAPLWKLGHVDGKIINVKRELTGSNTTVNALIDNICSLFDAVAIYNNINRTISFYHKDNVGTNRGLRVRENSYLKSFEDQFVSKDIVTRLYPFGQSGLTIQSVNPAGSSYIEDFSYFMSPFKRDNNRNVLQHSDYMSDELCHALLDYQEFYASKKDQAGELSKQYSAILKEHSQEDFRLNQLSATLQRLNERVELVKPKSEYIDLGTKVKNFKITVPKSSYYLIMIRNDGSFTRIKFNNKQYDIPSGEWLYIKLKTGKFNDATKFEKQLEYPLEILSANANLRVVYTRSSEGDYEEEDTKKSKKNIT